MEGRKMVEIVSTVNAQVSIVLREFHFDHTWRKKGDKYKIDFDLLQQMMYDNGTRAMFEDGTLYIQDMQTKIDLDLEPQDAVEPENIIVLDEAQMKRYMTVMPYHDFKEKMDKVSREQCIAVVQYAIANKIIDFDKFKYLQERTDIDPLRSIQMEQEAKED
jgi:predicted methyltransferase